MYAYNGMSAPMRYVLALLNHIAKAGSEYCSYFEVPKVVFLLVAKQACLDVDLCAKIVI